LFYLESAHSTVVLLKIVEKIYAPSPAPGNGNTGWNHPRGFHWRRHDGSFGWDMAIGGRRKVRLWCIVVKVVGGGRVAQGILPLVFIHPCYRRSRWIGLQPARSAGVPGIRTPADLRRASCGTPRLHVL